MSSETISALLERAVDARSVLFDERHQAAFRLFNGFLEGCPALAIDLYAATVVLHNYADPSEHGKPAHISKHACRGSIRLFSKYATRPIPERSKASCLSAAPRIGAYAKTVSGMQWMC